MANTATSNLPHCKGLFKRYQLLEDTYDEFFDDEKKGRPAIAETLRFFDRFSPDQFASLHEKAHHLFKQRGVTFNVYSDNCGQEKIFPFDLLPRMIDYKEWLTIQRGLVQRIHALNAFLLDIYGKQQILSDKKIPREIVLTSKGYIPKLQGIVPPGKKHIHIAGIDLVRDEKGFVVLEDNLKVPSGVSYVLENRRMTKQFFPHLFSQIPVLGTDEYPIQLKKALYSLSPQAKDEPFLVLLTPGPYNSAYFEHLYLAHRMGCPLVRNDELVVQNQKVYLKTFSGLKQVNMIYRRTDDDFLDPTFFNPKSLLGVPGLIEVYRQGNVLLANAPGNGVADDKGIYPYVPTIIRYYLNEEPILSQVETYSFDNPKKCEHILDNLSNYVVKIVNQSGGYGISIGQQASKNELKEVRNSILQNPRDYIAQPLIQLSTCPTFSDGKICPRRIDFRPFIVSGQSTWVLPGGLTRVALVKDSYIVNSSQGGGSKDTCVLGAL